MPTLSAPSELMLRNLELLEGHLLLAGDSRDAIAHELSRLNALSHIEIFSQDWAAHQALAAGCPPHATRHFGAAYPGPAQLDQLLLYLPKAKAQAELLLALLLPQLKPGSDILLIGENRGGISAAPKLLKPYGVSCVKRDAARRCSLFHGVLEHVPAPRPLDAFKQAFAVSAAGRELSLISLPGVFSHGRLDEGTRLLLESFVTQPLQAPTGSVLDIGCGAGVISSWLGLQYPEVGLSLLDVSALAIEASQLTLAANGLSGNVFASDGLSQAEGRYDVIVSNPPFHTGLGTDYEPTEQLLREAKRHLKPGGELRIVANSFLKYPPIIEQHLGTCEELAKTSKFKVYRAFNQR